MLPQFDNFAFKRLIPCLKLFEPFFGARHDERFGWFGACCGKSGYVSVGSYMRRGKDGRKGRWGPGERRGVGSLI